MAPPPEWLKAHERLSADITKASKKAKLPFRTLPDLVNTNVRYPDLIPVLIDWLRNVEKYTGLTENRDLSNFRDGLCRALTTIDAMGTEAVPLLFEQFYLDPPMPEVNADAVANALSYLAVPSDYDRMVAIASDRSLGSGRTAVLEWIIKQGREDGLQLVIDQIDDPSVRALGINYLRQYKPLPSGLRPKIEQYLDDPDSEVRKQAKLTLKKLPE